MMLRLAIGAVIVAHGLVHAALWLPQAVGAPLPEGAPFDTGRSWLLSAVSPQGARFVGGALAAMATVGLVAAGVGYAANQDWWRWVAAAGAGTSIALIVLYWNVWLSLGALIDAGVVALVLATAGASTADA